MAADFNWGVGNLRSGIRQGTGSPTAFPDWDTSQAGGASTLNYLV